MFLENRLTQKIRYSGNLWIENFITLPFSILGFPLNLSRSWIKGTWGMVLFCFSLWNRGAGGRSRVRNKNGVSVLLKPVSFCKFVASTGEIEITDCCSIFSSPWKVLWMIELRFRQPWCKEFNSHGRNWIGSDCLPIENCFFDSFETCWTNSG